MSLDPTQPSPTPTPGDGGSWYACRVEGCMVRTAQRAAHKAWHDSLRDVYTCPQCKALVRAEDRAGHDEWDASLVRLAAKLGVTLGLKL